MEINKAIAAVLVAGITFMLTGIIGGALIHPHQVHDPAWKVEAGIAPVAAGTKVEALVPISPMIATADVAAGEANAKKQCGACHSFVEGGKNGVGPNLYATMTRPRGASEGFVYSANLKVKGGVWSYEDLNIWLKKPTAFIPGTKMAYAGLNSDKQRAEIVAYLRTLSKTPVPLP
ncbi:MAG: cytochrome c family protein [Sandarakinorhabdus sp.]|nr:cytochrome c family protein [Sandarakinorhabdus sp.]